MLALDSSLLGVFHEVHSDHREESRLLHVVKSKATYNITPQKFKNHFEKMQILCSFRQRVRASVESCDTADSGMLLAGATHRVCLTPTVDSTA